MNLANRSEAVELMDDPNMDAKKFQEAYLDINRCNKMLGGYSITIKAVLDLLKKANKDSYIIYDMGCGDGEMLRKLAKVLKRNKIDALFVGIDLIDSVLDIARSKSKEYPNIQFKKQDILSMDATAECDVLLCTLTMHHFTNEQIDVFAKKFLQLAKIGVVINDLERNWLSYQLFKLYSLFFIKTKTAKVDGLISISKGFRKKELYDFAKNIPNVRHKIQWKWAFRYVWIMQNNRQN